MLLILLIFCIVLSVVLVVCCVHVEAPLTAVLMSVLLTECAFTQTTGELLQRLHLLHRGQHADPALHLRARRPVPCRYPGRCEVVLQVSFFDMIVHMLQRIRQCLQQKKT